MNRLTRFENGDETLQRKQKDSTEDAKRNSKTKNYFVRETGKKTKKIKKNQKVDMCHQIKWGQKCNFSMQLFPLDILDVRLDVRY